MKPETKFVEESKVEKDISLGIILISCIHITDKFLHFRSDYVVFSPYLRNFVLIEKLIL